MGPELSEVAALRLEVAALRVERGQLQITILQTQDVDARARLEAAIHAATVPGFTLGRSVQGVWTYTAVAEGA